MGLVKNDEAIFCKNGMRQYVGGSKCSQKLLSEAISSLGFKLLISSLSFWPLCHTFASLLLTWPITLIWHVQCQYFRTVWHSSSRGDCGVKQKNPLDTCRNKKVTKGGSPPKSVCENLHHAPPRWLMLDPYYDIRLSLLLHAVSYHCMDSMSRMSQASYIWELAVKESYFYICIRLNTPSGQQDRTPVPQPRTLLVY